MTDADTTCPVHADLATVSLLASEELPADFASCAHCAEGLRALRELRALGDSLAWTPPDGSRAAKVRAEVVRSLSSRSVPALRPRFGRFIPAAIGLAAAFSAVFVAFVATRHEVGAPSRSLPTEASLAVVRQVGVARFLTIGKAPDEVVRLEEGHVHVSVAHLGPAERFRIVTGDAVVEVRGTEFDVEASQSRLEAVVVQRGRVEVKVGAREPALLTEGARWSASERAAAPAAVPMPTPAPLRAAHIAESAVHRKEAVPAHVPAAAPESAAAQIPPPAPAALSSGEQLPAHRDVNLPATPPKPVVPAPAKPPEVIGAESQRREHEEQRSERRERRDERRLEHLERHR
jgi:hypothetical protein